MKRLLSVGIMSAPTISFSLRGKYVFNGKNYQGEYTATIENGRVGFCGEEYEELCFRGGDSFTLHEVTIGVNFHWQRKEDQSFKGDLKITAGHDRVLYNEPALIAVNLIDVEDYLVSVISSEMSATSSFELLKAHAVISRSWLLHPILNPHAGGNHQTSIETEKRIIRWYERDAHSLFDVCADDHCQRYQGITKQTSENVQRAIDETRGLVLRSIDNGEVCDARFYKSCGGATELFENCWADEHYPYLGAVRDDKDSILPDLTNETEAEHWIRTAPKAFCNTSDRRILQQVLNNYDQETQDFYRWKVEYTQEELSEIVRERSGIDFGLIEELIPIRRGPSARIYELKIVGEKRTMIVGKELEIRKWLSHSHLYSSAFVVDKQTSSDSQTIIFSLTGAGWGHGVGLCQIGAAVMADQGYKYEQILAHYFPNTELRPLR
ncbi:MAG: SpoIID/LytB domain-containing protein [Paludibacteraceae bacterium]|nr:SpoIID/LytB domain-containing protein [Paludibacteraceae bacterium]